MTLIDSSNSKENLSVLLNDIKNGKSDSFLVLVNLFRNRITSISCSFGLTETEREDLVQEGYIALYKAALTYDSSKGASFQTYVTVCAKRRSSKTSIKFLFLFLFLRLMILNSISSQSQAIASRMTLSLKHRWQILLLLQTKCCPITKRMCLIFTSKGTPLMRCARL